MTDITPKRTSEAWRSYTIHTCSWDAIVQFYRGLISKHCEFIPMLRIAEAIAASPAATEIHGATSMQDLLLSDCEDFRRGDSMLQISYKPSEQTFRFHHHSFFGNDDEKICTETEALQTLRLFLRLKYGVLFEVQTAND